MSNSKDTAFISGEDLDDAFSQLAGASSSKIRLQ